jgi:hypothetical protein
MNLENLKSSMKHTIFSNFYFNEKMKNKVKDKINHNSAPLMKKKSVLGPLLSVAFVTIFLIGTANLLITTLNESNNGATTNEILDTEQLTKVEQEEKLAGIPDEYNAPSVEVALQAIPFKVKLPQDLPIDSSPFTVDYIQDLSGDGKVIKIAFKSTSKNPEEFKILSLQATNQKSELQNSEKIKINSNIEGSFNNTQLIFEKSGVYYILDYISDEQLSPKELKELLIKIAQQMI